MDRDFLYSSAEVRHVKSVQFGVMSPDEIRRMSVVEVKHEVAWERGVPRHEGIMDRRLGASGRDFPCMTCHCDEKNCSGHFGFIELAKPMFHAGFMGMTLKLLRCVCYFCSRLLITKVDDPGVQKIDLVAVMETPPRVASPCGAARPARAPFGRPLLARTPSEGCWRSLSTAYDASHNFVLR